MRWLLINRATLARAAYVLRNEGLRKLAAKVLSTLGNVFLTHSPVEVDLILKAFRRHQIRGIMVDVGAGTGTSLAPFACSDWIIHAFEPDSRNRTKLEAVFTGWKLIKIDPRAVSDVNRINVPFYTSEESIGISSLVPFRDSHVQSGIVTTTTLSDYINEAGIGQVDFLKIDTEGHDLDVLRGFPWDKVLPIVVMCEFDDAKTKSLGHSWKDLTQLLSDHGYQIILSEWEPIARYGEPKLWQGFSIVPCNLSTPNSWGNLIAVRSSEMFETLLHQFRRFVQRRDTRKKLQENQKGQDPSN